MNTVYLNRPYKIIETNSGIIYDIKKAKNIKDACRKAMNKHTSIYRGECEFEEYIDK